MDFEKSMNSFETKKDIIIIIIYWTFYSKVNF